MMRIQATAIVSNPYSDNVLYELTIDVPLTQIASGMLYKAPSKGVVGNRRLGHKTVMFIEVWSFISKAYAPNSDFSQPLPSLYVSIFA